MMDKRQHGKRNLPMWTRLSERKRLQLSYRELLGALGDLSAQHTTFLEKHNQLVLAYKHLQLEVNALRRLADPTAYRQALELEVEAIKARMAAARGADAPEQPPEATELETTGGEAA